MKRPVVGMPAGIEQARIGPWDEHAAELPLAYARAVQAAGALALMIPPDDVLARDPDEVLDRIDALLLAGGGDVDPTSYGARPHVHTKSADPARDRFELALAHRAVERDLPLLGVCRGAQMMNVALGGTLEQHLPDVLGSDRHAQTPGVFADHEVRVEPGSLAHRATGAGRCAVKSHHHQGLAELGEGLVPTAWSVPDGLVEAVEAPAQRFALGVLWHPEEDERSRVIAGLVEGTRAAIGARR